jgi:hypothetical protein
MAAAASYQISLQDAELLLVNDRRCKTPTTIFLKNKDGTGRNQRC